MPFRCTKALPLREWICPSCRSRAQTSLVPPFGQGLRALQTQAHQSNSVPFRKQLKDEAKRKRAKDPQEQGGAREIVDAKLADWELTVGIEIHAQLNTSRKLFSRATTIANDRPNANAALFDLALPGTQPEFQTGALLPALRAALALKCNVQRISRFDRKHYFYQDQPAGYQITQYYAPFAKDGYITLDRHDGIAGEDGDSIKIGIKQIQMEQDTAKTIIQPPDTCLLDFNRVGHPLVEIITLPQIHHPQTAAACVRKIQQVLQAVSSVTTGMELGGLRADVNVSVRSLKSLAGSHSYHGVMGLGQRTEIKNLSSFKAVEDAIIAERDRQIGILDGGGTIEGETRGWTLGSTETRRLRGKEGEVDYRYMPDPDLPAVVIGKDLIDHIEHSLPMLPDEQTRLLTEDFGLSMKDAKTLVSLEGGLRLDYFQDVTNALLNQLGSSDTTEMGRVSGNWVLHELGGLVSASERYFEPTQVAASSLAAIIANLVRGNITGSTAKQILSKVFDGDSREVGNIIREDNMQIQHLSDQEYHEMARMVVDSNPGMAAKVQEGQVGKLQWFVGQMMREGRGRVDAQRAKQALETLFGVKA